MGWAFDLGKILLTAVIIFSVAQISERSTLLAAVLASIPIVSVLSMMMMFHEGQTAIEISSFAKDIVWLLIPSLLMFIVMPWLIESLALATRLGGDACMRAARSCAPPAFCRRCGARRGRAESRGAFGGVRLPCRANGAGAGKRGVSWG